MLLNIRKIIDPTEIRRDITTMSEEEFFEICSGVAEAKAFLGKLSPEARAAAWGSVHDNYISYLRNLTDDSPERWQVITDLLPELRTLHC